jgi:TonB family protein
MISAWLESHKRYPESARERAEQGSAALRFRIDRSGRVVDYSYASTGYADLDAGLDELLRGAQLPPFGAIISSIWRRPTEPTRSGVRGRCCPTTRRRNCGPTRQAG